MNKLKIYRVQYASGLFRSKNSNQEQYIYSDTKLKENEFIVVEHKECGLFIGKVIEECSDNFEIFDEEIIHEIEYKYIQKIDLSKYFESIEKAKRKEELKSKMISQFRKIDEEKKYQYYAELDDEFRKIYEEYKSID